MCSNLLLYLVAICIKIIGVCIRRMFAIILVVVTVWGSCGNVCCVSDVVKYSV